VKNNVRKIIKYKGEIYVSKKKILSTANITKIIKKNFFLLIIKRISAVKIYLFLGEEE
jgi:hypothetical protein